MPEKPIDPAHYDQPHVVTDVLLAFPGDLGDLLPDESIIPEEFWKRSFENPWVAWQDKWFFSGLKEFPSPKDGVNAVQALRHLSCIQNSFQPKHEHKAAAVAWLASKWLQPPG